MQNHSRHDGPFAGRTVAVVNDLSLDEQLYLYHKARDIKAAAHSGAHLSAFRLDDRDYQVYLIFMEDSTRTK
jgi:aspartate carbamoyltransferase